MDSHCRIGRKRIGLKTLLIVLLLVGNVACAEALPRFLPDLQEARSDPSVSNTLPAAFPLITPAGAPVPDAVRRRLPAAMPAGEGEPEAAHRRILEKRVEAGKVMLILKEEGTRELSRLTEPTGTMVSVLESEDDTTQQTSPADVLPTRKIESVKPGMQILSRLSNAGKTLARTFHDRATESVKLDLARDKAGKVVESLRGLPQTTLPTSAGTLSLSKLKPGMKALLRRGPPLIVKSVSREKHPNGLSVYSFEAEAKAVAEEGNPTETPERISKSERPTAENSLSEEEAAIADALRHLRAGTRPSYGRKWGEPFLNREGRLPGGRGAGGYREYYVRPAPGESGPGARRLVVGTNGSIYFTRDHYRTFVKIQ